MKKIVLVAAVATFAMGLGSCKKEYTCECSYTSGGQTYTSSSKITATKKDAKAACTASGLAGYSCSIK